MSRNEKSQAVAEQWRPHIEAWKVSGQSQSAFCQANSLSYHRFGYWHRKLTTRKKTVDTGGFVAVSKRPPATESLSIALPQGMVLRGITADNLAVVFQLLSHLA